MFRMVQVVVIYENVVEDPQPLEGLVGQLSREWLRACFNCWFLWSDKSNVTIAEMMKTQLASADQVVVVGVDTTQPAHGFLNQWIWDWWNAERNPITGDRVAGEWAALLTDHSGTDWGSLLEGIGQKP